MVKDSSSSLGVDGSPNIIVLVVNSIGFSIVEDSAVKFVA